MRPPSRPITCRLAVTDRGSPSCTKRFVLAFQGGSIDIDGSTIYYDSGAGAWRKFHNDSSDDRQAYAALTAGLAECELKGQ